MPSEVSICNMALSRLGANRISALTEASREARECSLAFAQARDSVLRDHPWNFANRVQYLALTEDEPFGFAYAYAYPSDCLAARKIWQEVDTDTPIDFEVRQNDAATARVIVTDEADAALVYTARIENPNVWDAQFVDALVLRLATDLALPLTQNAQIQNAMAQLYQRTIFAAKTQDAKEGRTEPESTSSFIFARS